MRSLAAAAIALVSLTAATPAVRSQPLAPAPTAGAGAAAVDITPMPGLATGGHGPAGTIARGYWDRLRAVAFYFEDPEGRGFALVSADLFAVPTGLHQAVAAHFTPTNSGNLTGVVLSLERVVIAATHTHQGPGNYLSAKLYNDLGSKKRGFNRPLRAFLEAQVIRAVEFAIVDARTSVEPVIDVLTGMVGADLFLNRSPAVFMRDSRSQVILGALGAGLPTTKAECLAARREHEPDKDWEWKGCPRLRAVDRNVTILRLRRDGRTRAMALFVNVHPTVLPSRTPLYSGDLFGTTRRVLETGFGADPPIIGFFNGAEGDVVTRRTTRTAADLVHLSRLFAKRIADIHDTAAPTAVDLSRGITAALHYAQPGDAAPAPGSGSVRLASEGMGGVAALGGAEGDPSVVSVKPKTRKSTGEHGVKVPALGIFNRLIAPARNFPKALPLGFVRLGTFSLATTPTEKSTATVWRIREALGGPPHGALEVISLANDYASYTATADEYGAQDYMGASTMWGSEQAAFFTAVLGRVAGQAGVSGKPGADEPGSERTFRSGDVGRFRGKAHDGLDALIAGVEGQRLPAFEWCGAAPMSIGLPGHLVEVIAVGDPYRDTLGVVVVLRTTPKNRRIMWSALWLTPLWETRQGLYRFRVVEGGRTIESQPFAVGSSPPPACSRDGR